MRRGRTLALGLGVTATILLLAAAFVTARSALYLLAGIGAVATLVAWRRRRAP